METSFKRDRVCASVCMCVCVVRERALKFCSSIQAEKSDRLSRHVFMLGTALNVYSEKRKCRGQSNQLKTSRNWLEDVTLLVLAAFAITKIKPNC